MGKSDNLRVIIQGGILITEQPFLYFRITSNSIYKIFISRSIHKTSNHQACESVLPTSSISLS